jgi:uncharacterized protein (TIGR00297 family)
MVDRSDAADEEPQQLSEHRLVVGAADAPRGRVERYRPRYLEQHVAADPPHRAVRVAGRDAPRPAQRERSGDQRRQQPKEFSAERIDGFVGFARQVTAGRAKYRFGVRAAAYEFGERDGLVLRGAVPFSDRFRVAFYLEIDGVAKTEAFVPELVHEFGFEISGSIHITHGLEQTERKERVDGREHRRKPTTSIAVLQRLCCGVAHIARWVVGLTLAATVAITARRFGVLSTSGALMATILGTVAVAAGWDWAVVLIVYFVSSSLLTRFRAADKASRVEGRIEKGGARDAIQVLANGGAFAVAAVAYLASGNDVWRLVAAGALAASAADTWSTELGTLARSVPRSILTWKRADVGTSGAVTVVGLLAGLGGAAMVAATARLTGWGSSTVVAALVGGFVGCLVDSLLGASLQARRWCAVCRASTEQRIHRCGAETTLTGGLRWLNNDGVNALSSAIGALLGVAVAS